MAIKSLVTCDVTGKELGSNDMQKATVCVVQFRKVGKVPGFNGKPDIECLKEIENYEFHVCHERAAEFMEELKKVFEKLKGGE